MKYKEYKGNRPSYSQTELNYQKAQLKMQENLLERWDRVNNKLVEKGQPPRHSQEKIKQLKEDIDGKRYTIEKILTYN